MLSGVFCFYSFVFVCLASSAPENCYMGVWSTLQHTSAHQLCFMHQAEGLRMTKGTKNVKIFEETPLNCYKFQLVKVESLNCIERQFLSEAEVKAAAFIAMSFCCSKVMLCSTYNSFRIFLCTFILLSIRSLQGH